MTKQEFFTRTIQNLRLQGEAARDQFTGGCKYHLKVGDKTLKCAIGGHLSDQSYCEAIEGQIVGSAPSKLLSGILDYNGIGEELYPLAAKLQKIHDQHDQSLWENHWKALAISYGLDFPEKEI